MANEQIKKYIEESVKAGHSKASIKESLKTAGWKEDDMAGLLDDAPAQGQSIVPAGKGINRKTMIAAGVAVLVIALGAGAYAWYAGKMGGSQTGTPKPAQNGGTTATTPETPAVVAATCTDTDEAQGANAIYAKGTVTAVDSTGSQTINEDECATEDPQYLIEWVCAESPAGSKNLGAGRTIVKCPTTCKNGACIK